MAVTVTITTTGLITYALHKKRIDAVIPATARTPHAEHGDHRGDVHLPALILPLWPLQSDTATPDHIFDSGGTELGLWRLHDTLMEVWVDGNVPRDDLEYEKHECKCKPPEADEDDLCWLADVRKAAANPKCELRPDCRPPTPNPALVSAVVQMRTGKATAYWSSPLTKEQIWEFKTSDPPPFELPEYKQALADGVTWTFTFDSFAEIRLTSTSSGSLRSIYLQQPKSGDLDAPVGIDGTVSHKSPTVDGVSVLQPAAQGLSHFALFYQLVTPPPGPLHRRIPFRARAATHTNRCPPAAA